MSVEPVPGATPEAPSQSSPKEITIVSHSTLFYWWPVWAVGFLMFFLTYIDGHRLATVPAGTVATRDVEVPVADKEGRTGREPRDVLILPKGAHLAGEDPTDPNSPPANPHLHIAKGKSYGVLFATVLLLVILITNVPLRGMWSAAIIGLIIIVVLLLSLFDLWARILANLRLLDIRINAGGYLLISSVLFAIWLIVLLVFDKQIYMVFSPGQFKVKTELGGGEKVYDAMGMTLERQRSDLFRHWILGLGSGDLIVKTSGAQAHHFDLPNVLFIGRKVQQIEDMLRERKMVSK